MANVKNFSFVTQIVTGYLKLEGGNKTPISTNIKVFGEYNPDECSRETGVSYEIKEVYDGYYLPGSFHIENNLTKMFNACEIYEGPVSKKIHEAAIANVEYLTGYKSREMVMTPFPNPDTLKTKSA